MLVIIVIDIRDAYMRFPMSYDTINVAIYS
jgi:hypothetical protein